MPRRHPRPERPRPPAAAATSTDGTDYEQHPDGNWYVRRLTGASALKAYRCPGCGQEIPGGTPHVVAWSAEGDGTDRRHWHASCWAARNRRHPPGGR
ncbi:MAG TPA: hypothetical protein VHU88_09285 [Sporichthyaceae bacterium]|nr:hypothetical protein [Sporichthyaceae bacterium]